MSDRTPTNWHEWRPVIISNIRKEIESQCEKIGDPRTAHDLRFKAVEEATHLLQVLVSVIMEKTIELKDLVRFMK